MKPYLLQMLKELAMLGAMNNKIEVSSIELASQLETSQQTASRYLLELDKEGFIQREFGVKKQRISINGRGVDALEDEYSQYKQIFELKSKVRFKGKVISGLGEGKYYTEQPGYLEQFKQLLSIDPYPGTFNVEIKPIEKNKLRLLKHYGGIDIKEFTTKNRSFGSAICFNATVNGVKGAIVLPRRSHYSNVIEVISHQCIRDSLKVKDGDHVEVIVFVK